jgi:hypothetical protein
MTDVERVARIIARASFVRLAAAEGVDAEGTPEARIVTNCAEDFLWTDYTGTARDFLEALGVAE